MTRERRREFELGTAPDGAIRPHYGLRMRQCDFWRRYVEAGSPLPNATTVSRYSRMVEAERTSGYSQEWPWSFSSKWARVLSPTTWGACAPVE